MSIFGFYIKYIILFRRYFKKSQLYIIKYNNLKKFKYNIYLAIFKLFLLSYIVKIAT